MEKLIYMASKERGMKILIVGAGAVASVIARKLAKDPKISKIVCGTNDVKRGKGFIDTKKKKVRLIKLDASSTADVAKAAEGMDLIINASLPDFNEKVMEAALKAKANYQDLCSRLADLKNAEQLKFHKRFQKAGLRAIINTGVAPGVTNLLAREAADHLDSLEEIKIRCVEDQKASEFVPSWSTEVTLDEVTADPLVYRKRKFSFVRPFEEMEEYTFPHPIGKRIVSSLYGDEIATIPLYIKVKNVDMKSCGSEVDFSKALYKMGLLSMKPVSVSGAKVVPIELFIKVAPKVPSPTEMMVLMKKGVVENALFVLSVEAIGKEEGKKIRIKNSVIFPDLKEISKISPGATYISYPTGISSSAFVKAVGKLEKPGVFPPEALSREIRKEVLLELENSGIVVDETFVRA